MIILRKKGKFGISSFSRFSLDRKFAFNEYVVDVYLFTFKIYVCLFFKYLDIR